MSADDVSRILSPRKALQRTGSQSSASSSSSAASSSTLAANTYQAALAQSRTNGDTSAHGSRKKSAGRLWPPAKPEPAASSSAGRAPSGSQSAAGGQSVSLFPNMHSQGPFLPSQQQQQQPPMHGHIQQGRGNALAGPHDPTAILYLLPMNGTFERKTITVPYYPDYLRVGRQTNQRSTPTPLNGYFDSKVLSRQHAEIWADHDGRIWIRDVRSSNGTFVDGQRLSQEGRESDPHEIREQSVLELGIDIVGEDQKTVVHHKVAAMVERAGFFNSNDFLDMNFNFNDFEQSTGTGVAANVLPPPLVPMPRGRSGSQGAIGTTSRTGSVTSAATHHFNPNGQNRNLNFWLNPVSMEQIVKRLNVSCSAGWLLLSYGGRVSRLLLMLHSRN